MGEGMASRRKFKFQLLLVIVMMAVSLLLVAKPSYALSYGYLAYPQGNVGLVQPEIGISLELSEGITPESYQFYLNNKEVSAHYDPVSVKFTYTPPADLAPGDYNAQLVLNYSGYQPVSISWKFTVTKDAVKQTTSVTKEQEEGLRAINDYRTKLGLSTIKWSDTLATAAQKHAQYLAINKIDPIRTSVSLHDEDPALPGYIGKTLRERVQFIGYARSSSEDVAYTQSSLVEAIDSLFDAPYHRSPFLVPTLIEIGLYKEGNYDIVEFGFAENASPELIVSPGPNDVYVPIAFDGHETPDPIRMHKDASYPVGYPIMAALYGSDIKSVRAEQATLKDEKGATIPLLTNDAGNDDHLDNEVIFLPSSPLAPDTTYKVDISLKATMENGDEKTFTKAWSFHTEPLEGIGVRKLHQNAIEYKLLMGNMGMNRSHTVSIGLNGNTYTLDQISYSLTQTPSLIDGSSYLYIRDLAAALGATVSWDDAEKAAIYVKKGTTIKFFTTRDAYSVNGVEHLTTTPAKLVNERTMMPVRLLSEALGANVTFDDVTKTVHIAY